MALAKIVYASMTGNTQEIAEIVADKLEDLGLDVDLDECTTVDAEDFVDADLCIVATYTYGDGELPDEIVDFYEDLADVDLAGKTFGVCGSGDTFYDDFCVCIDMFEEQFAVAGAEKGADCVRVDLNAEEEDIVNLEAFASALAEKVQ
ncbi:flavodoxin [Lactococcus termiticola]|uniref:Flavodoxin n=1 Tax=Lactococcus termiticola TaxID=2169526 RepID=A0A2R5HJV9_9LACT|nr:flavodoxin [Lactococcus termiticola]GBG96978.1 flavodoxin [Lactococcus termiticola]